MIYACCVEWCFLSIQMEIKFIVVLSDCSSIIWTLGDAGPVVLRVYIHNPEHLLLCNQQSGLNTTSQYMTEKDVL